MTIETLSQSFKWKALTMLSQVAESRHLIQHNGIFGENNEQLLIDLLRTYLDDMWEVASGEVIDVNGTRSPQCDVIIYNARLIAPSFRSISGKLIIPAHAVGAILEVKTSLQAGQSDQGSTIPLLCSQVHDIQTYCDRALLLGNALLKARHQERLASTIEANGARIWVPGFAFSSTIRANTIQKLLHSVLQKGEIPPPHLYVLDVARSAKQIQTEFQNIGSKPSRSAVIKFAEQIRLPNGYVFRCEKYTETKAGAETGINFEHIVRDRIGELVLQQLLSDISEHLHYAAPSRMELPSEDKHCLYKAYTGRL